MEERIAPLLSVGVEDEIFVLGSYGLLIRVYELIAHINSHPSEFEPRWRRTSELLRFRRSDGIRREHISRMPPSRRDQPLLVTKIDDDDWVLDGNHRLLRRHRDGCGETLVLEVSLDVLRRFAELLGL